MADDKVFIDVEVRYHISEKHNEQHEILFNMTEWPFKYASIGFPYMSASINLSDGKTCVMCEINRLRKQVVELEKANLTFSNHEILHVTHVTAYGRCFQCENERLQKQVTELQEANTREVNMRRTGFIAMIQAEQKEWELKNFGKTEWFIGSTGITEEIGELFEYIYGLVISNGRLSHSLLKKHEGIRINEPHIENAKDAVGDIVAYLMSLCNTMGWDLQTIISDTWNNVVKKRNWKQNTTNGEITKENAIKRYQCTNCLAYNYFEIGKQPKCCNILMVSTDPIHKCNSNCEIHHDNSEI